ncbi:MAG: hypothetical protein JOZ81_20900 [Chloroflexi bacterium]|nr:hypothetical protein [Chloroflexota bacterium]
MTPNQIATMSPVPLRRLLDATDGHYSLDGFLSRPDGREMVQHFATVIDTSVRKSEQVKALRSALILAAKRCPELASARPGIRIRHYASGAINVSLWTYGGTCRCHFDEYE